MKSGSSDRLAATRANRRMGSKRGCCEYHEHLLRHERGKERLLRMQFKNKLFGWTIESLFKGKHFHDERTTDSLQDFHYHNLVKAWGDHCSRTYVL